MDEIVEKKTGWGSVVIKTMVPILIIVAGVMVARQLYATKPVAKRTQKPSPAPLVETRPVHKTSKTVTITAMGSVIPARKITLKSKVGGDVIATSPEFLPGGVYKKGDLILRLDPRDYQLAVSREKNILSRQQATLALEMGQQEIAREELTLMQSVSGKTLNNPDLALRKPQLAQIKADIGTARVALEQARLNLARTEIRAPFNGVILEKNIEKGSHVTPQDTLATLTGTDACWIEAQVSTHMLPWIIFPQTTADQGSPVTITATGEIKRTGHVIRLLGDINPESRMARILIQIKDPLGLEEKNEGGRILLGSYVKVAIQGRTMEEIFEIPRSAVRDGDRVWLARGKKLAIQTVTPLWKDRSVIYVKKELSDGDILITSDIPAPVPGMALRTGKDKPGLKTIAHKGKPRTP